MTISAPLLRRRANDEFRAPRRTRAERAAGAATAADLADLAHHTGLDVRAVIGDRRVTASTLRRLDEAHGGGWFDVPDAATVDADAADACFSGAAPVVDVQTHLVDARRFGGAPGDALGAFLRNVDPGRWAQALDPRRIDAHAWASLVFGTSETAIALLTSTPGPVEANLISNPQIAAAREVVERYASSGRVLTHAIVHPNVVGDPARDADHLCALAETVRPSGWKCYTLYGPPTDAAPGGGWFLDDEVVGVPFLEAVRATGCRVVAAHKGLGGPIDRPADDSASPRDIGAAAARFPDLTFVVYHSGYDIDPLHPEGAFDPVAPHGVDRLIAGLAQHDIGPHDNVYAELGSTWYLILRRPREAAHVLGKLLRAIGPERILWGTDSTWYGSPQPLIDSFRAFTIPEAMQDEFGYPALTPAVKEQVLSANAISAYEIAPEVLDGAVADRDRTWVPDAARELLAVVEA